MWLFARAHGVIYQEMWTGNFKKLNITKGVVFPLRTVSNWGTHYCLQTVPACLIYIHCEFQLMSIFLVLSKIYYLREHFVGFVRWLCCRLCYWDLILWCNSKAMIRLSWKSTCIFVRCQNFECGNTDIGLICPPPLYSSCYFLRYEAISLSPCFSLPLSTVQGHGVRLLIAQKKSTQTLGG